MFAGETDARRRFSGLLNVRSGVAGKKDFTEPESVVSISQLSCHGDKNFRSEQHASTLFCFWNVTSAAEGVTTHAAVGRCYSHVFRA
jgi:hypothetical protein